jgi:NADH-quinone oxidoreductase subunit J
VQLVIFYIFAIISILGALLMVTRKNPLTGAFALVVSLASLAGVFAMLNAEFIFILQILLYAGAIMVLIIFTIMLLNLAPAELKEPPVGRVKAVVILVLTAVGLVNFIRVLQTLPGKPPPDNIAADFGTIEQVGHLMLGQYLYPFEVISVLLLVAVVGVVLLAKKVI